MKYHHEEALAWRLGRVLGQLALARQVRDKTYDLVVPVPLHVTRLRKRGYNQSAWLAKSLAKQQGLAWDPFVLRKVSRTPVQTGLPRDQRLKNVRNSFAVDSDQVAGKRILLVDDVYTTGATLEACARVLKKAGAKEVDTSVIARTA
jgi:ComF family protein